MISDSQLLELAREHCCLGSEESYLLDLLRSLRKFEVKKVEGRSPEVVSAVKELDKTLSTALLRLACAAIS